MGTSEPGHVRRNLALVVTASALVAGALVAPAQATDPIKPVRFLRLAPEPRAGVQAIDVPLRSEFRPGAGGRYRTPRMGASAFSMVGFTWPSGDARLRVRVRTDGRWGTWQTAEPLADLPDSSSGERAGGRSGTELAWVGGSDGVQVESEAAPVRDLEMTLIEPGGEPRPTTRPAASRPRPARAPWPAGLRSREDWGADERLRDGRPGYNRTIQQVHVHHTVSSNRYTRAQVPGMIRGIYRYHTQSLGWSDIAYNFLVDRFGRSWVGRAGGPGKPVRGAHTLGFNTTSTGIAVIGNYETAHPSNKVITAIVQIAAWKLDKYGRNPEGTAKVYSHGSDRFPAGRRVRLPVIDGHRDTNDTACPGGRLYAKLPNIRRRTAQRISYYN